MTLPVRIAKRIAGRCLHCAEPAIDGSDYCAVHDAKERGRLAGKQRRKRQRLASQGLCRDGCGTKVPKRRKPDGSFVLVRCRPCKRKRKKDAEAKRKSSGVPQEGSGVPDEAADPAMTDAGFDARLEQSPDGKLRARRRFHGQGKRGRQSIEQLAAEARVNVVRCMDRGLEHLAAYRTDEVQAMPRIQRDEYREAALDQLRHAQRWIDEMIELHAPKSRKSEQSSEDDDE